MIQDVLAIIIVSGTVLYVVWHIYKIYISKNRKQDQSCMGCPSGSACHLKELKSTIEKKKEGCENPERL